MTTWPRMREACFLEVRLPCRSATANCCSGPGREFIFGSTGRDRIREGSSLPSLADRVRLLLFRLHAGFLYHLGVLGRLGLDESGKLAWRVANRFCALFCQSIPHVARLGCFDGLSA